MTIYDSLLLLLVATLLASCVGTDPVYAEQFNQTLGSPHIHDFLLRWAPVCAQHNRVLGRRIWGRKELNWDFLRPDWVQEWTVSADVKGPQREHLLHSSYCENRTLDDTLDAVKSGRYHCALNIFSENEMCSIFSRYEKVVFMGDSLTRHMTQALLILFSRDARWGGIPRREGPLEMYSNCQCDGQFSENALCRVNNSFSLPDLKTYGLCSSNMDAAGNVSTSFSYNYGYVPPDIECNEDKRPWLFLAQGGSGSDLDDIGGFLEKCINPVVGKIKQMKSTCPGKKLHLIVTLANAQDPKLNKHFPKQGRERAIEFNNLTFSKIKEIHPEAILVDFFNITLDAPSPDGYHYLMSTNIQKANVLLNIMHKIA